MCQFAGSGLSPIATAIIPMIQIKKKKSLELNNLP